jgi:predicted flavoprotein YhiN
MSRSAGTPDRLSAGLVADGGASLPSTGAAIIPFPCLRRQTFIVRQTRRMSALPLQQAEAYLAQQLRVQSDTMCRKGVASHRVNYEINQLETAIRAALKHFIRMPDGTV